MHEKSQVNKPKSSVKQAILADFSILTDFLVHYNSKNIRIISQLFNHVSFIEFKIEKHLLNEHLAFQKRKKKIYQPL